MIMASNANGSSPTSASPGAALYVDNENLRDSDRAQDAISLAVANWPGDRPALGSLSLYVRADKVAVWEMWAEGACTGLRVRVRGVQHFSNHKAKNSADLAITADAVADLVTGQASAVAVLSNDSDFGALFVKVRELAQASGQQQTPFLWITSPDAGGLSPEMERFIPAGLRWDLSANTPEPGPAAKLPEAESLPEVGKQTTPARSQRAARNAANPGNEDIAEELLRQLPVGTFRAGAAQGVVRERWPKHEQAAVNTAEFGKFMFGEIWPILEERGVLMPRRSSPRTYEITQSAKDSVAKAQPKPSAPGDASAEPDPARLAAAIAAAITEDLFSATAAQPAIKSGWPEHTAASCTAARFGAWFANHIWPVMEQHGVTLASEKPRRYEMTPDARHRLMSLA